MIPIYFPLISTVWVSFDSPYIHIFSISSFAFSIFKFYKFFSNYSESSHESWVITTFKDSIISWEYRTLFYFLYCLNWSNKFLISFENVWVLKWFKGQKVTEPPNKVLKNFWRPDCTIWENCFFSASGSLTSRTTTVSYPKNRFLFFVDFFIPDAFWEIWFINYMKLLFAKDMLRLNIV